MTDSCRESSCVRALALDLNGRFIDGWMVQVLPTSDSPVIPAFKSHGRRWDSKKVVCLPE